MKNYLLTFSSILFLFISNMAFSQISFSVQGKLILEDGYLPSGNIIALHPKDSTFLTGNSFFDGTFELNNLTNEKILLQFSSLEFDDTFLNVNYQNHSVIDLGEIIVKKTDVALHEIVVKGKRSRFQQRADGTVEVLIANTTLAASNSVNEILSKSPEILVDENGDFSVFGKGIAILYLNGKRILNSQLSFIDPVNIQKIEIIRNPSSKYDAEGGAVINIMTIKKNSNGYQTNLKQNLSYSDFGGANFHSSININFNQGRFSSNAFYNLYKGDEREILYTTRDRKPEDIFLKTDLTTDWQSDFRNSSAYGLGMQLDGKKNNYISAEYSGSYFHLAGSQISNNTITDDSGVNFYTSDIARDEKTIENSISLNYNQTLDTFGTGLFLGLQFSKFNGGNDNFITEESKLISENVLRFLENISDLNVNIISGQSDFIKKYNNKSTLESGAKFSYVNNNYNQDFLVADQDLNFVVDNNLSNFFKYKETIGAAYFTFKNSFKENINYSFGLRTEYTAYNLEVASEMDLIQDKYWNFFPNISTNFKLKENYHLNFSYTARINRPAYHRLNPVIFYQDPYTSIQGNPNLIPEKTHAFELNNQVNKLNFKLGYNYTIDPLGARAVRGNDERSYILKPGNFDHRHLFYASISRTFNIDWWTSINTLSVNHTNITDTQFEIEIIKPRPNLYFYTNNIFTIPKLFNIEVMFWYLGDQYTGITHRLDMSSLTFTIEKSFLENQLKCRLIANDVFHDYIAAGFYNVGQTDIYFNRRWSTNYFRLSMTYNFGRLKQNNYKNKGIGKSERERM